MKGGKGCIDNMENEVSDSEDYEGIESESEEDLDGHPHRSRRSKRGSAVTTGRSRMQYLDPTTWILYSARRDLSHSREISVPTFLSLPGKGLLTGRWLVGNMMPLIGSGLSAWRFASHMSGWWKSILGDSPAQG
ncbi:hypothetical protein FRC02_003801 [Tulasnella sp. 418]|nr:hypothetical protein FRC02_003801 [Tulasnella sp. 418]